MVRDGSFTVYDAKKWPWLHGNFFGSEMYKNDCIKLLTCKNEKK